jgi:hypothetical protein
MAASLKILFQAFRVKVSEKLNALNEKIELITTGELSADSGNSLTKGSDNLPFYKERTAAEIKTAYESNTNTNAFTDTHKTNLENLGTDLTKKADLDETGKVRPDQIPNFAITNVVPADPADNTIDLFAANSFNYSFDTGDAIEIVEAGGGLLHYLFNGEDRTLTSSYRPLSTLGESKEMIKAKYESNPDTNAFTDNEKTKLGAVPAPETLETQTGATDKANAAETAAKNYADTGDAGTLLSANNYADSIGATKVDKDGSKVLTDVNYSQADKDKLDGVEAGATGDQTGAEIKAAYESEANTNAFTDAEKTKLAGLESPKFKGTFVSESALTTAFPTANEGESAHVDSGVSGKVELWLWDNSDNLWRIAKGEGTEETAASIKTKYESNPDTNNFSDSLKSKLDGVAAGATANDSDANLKNRANHTGTQTAATISDFETAVKGTSRQYTKQQNPAKGDLTDEATLNWNLDSAQYGKLIATAGVGDNRTLPNSILTAGVEAGEYKLHFKQDSVGGRKIIFDTDFTVVGEFDLNPDAITLLSLTIEAGKGLVVLSTWNGVIAGEVTKQYVDDQDAALSTRVTTLETFKTNLDAPLVVSASRALAATDINRILYVTASVSLTWPSGGITGFKCNIECNATGALTILDENTGNDLSAPNGTELAAEESAYLFIEPVAGKLRISK